MTDAKAGKVHWMRTIAARLIGIVTVLFLVSIALLVESFHFVDSIGGDSQWINVAGMRRTRVYQMLYYANRLFDTGRDPQVEASLTQAMARLDERLQPSTRVGRGAGTPFTPEIQKAITEIEDVWRTRLRPLVSRVMQAQSLDEAAPTLAELDHVGREFFEKSDALVERYQEAVQQKLEGFRRMQILFLVFICAVFILVVLNARRVIERERAAQERNVLLDAIRIAVEDVNAASHGILATTSQQASGAQQQAATVSETAVTADEVAQTAGQVAERAKTVSDSVRRTAEVGEAGRQAVEGSITALQSLREQVESTAQTILALAEQAQAIGEIIATVNDIAEQTNLLALNAAIEASRAGEHGKGFGVVAAEVKELANQSKQATVQVRQILGEIQKATNAAVLSTEAVTRGMSDATEISSRAGAAIHVLAEALSEAAQAGMQIAASAGQQAQAMAQITQATKNIHLVTKESLEATQRSEAAARNLAAIGERLAELTRGPGVRPL
ncbi:MAG: hypothetical protein QOD06_1014 [Candidatus Binatota bacterium]|jgi:hypothetical protein|nr:hypothetical protein [Candidatus Binatota bacterium]